MNLYNMLVGENEYADILLKVLGVEKQNIGRYRDCFFNGEHIVIFTRTGGGNREYHEDDNAMLQNLNHYSHDKDDEYDHTYAWFYFNVPDQYRHCFEFETKAN
jgi:hypothetical protein